MEVEPAHVDQVLLGADGSFVEVSADVGSVVAELRRIDPGLKVRFNERGQCWHVYHQPDERNTYLVLTAQAHQGVTGVWMGLDNRIVERVRRISSDDYDFAAEVEKQNRAADKAKADHKAETLGEAGERAFHMIRKLEGRTDRAFIKK